MRYRHPSIQLCRPILAALGLLIIHLSYAEAPHMEAGIHIQTEQSQLQAQGFIHNLSQQTQADLRYQFHLVKTGPSGTSRSQQSGQLQLDAQEQKHLGQVAFNLDAQARYALTLSVWQGQQLVAEAQEQWPPTANEH